MCERIGVLGTVFDGWTLSDIDEVNGDDRREFIDEDVIELLWSSEGGCGKVGEL